MAELEMTKMLTVSTAHVSEETLTGLSTGWEQDSMSLPVYVKTTPGDMAAYGVFIYLESAALETAQVPDDLAVLIGLCKENGCGILCLDSDGPVVEGIPVYQYNGGMRMGRTYVEMGQLENIFSRNGIPYTNIFDELKQLSPAQVAGDMTVHELRECLDAKDEVFATQVWTRGDISASMRSNNMKDMSSEMIDRIIADAKAPLEDCSDNWEKLDAIVSGFADGEDA